MEAISLFNFVMLFLLAAAVTADDDIKALVGDTATLICPIVPSCGPLHSIKWYRENERIAVMAETSNFVKIEGSMKDRIKVSLNSMKDLKISPVEIDDEGQFRCELTYLEPTENCDSIHELKFRTLLKPKSLTIYDQNAKEIRDGSPLGGLLEYSETAVECRVDGGKPIPTLKWILGDEEAPGHISTTGQGDNALTTNRLNFSVERKLQGKQLQCIVSSEALEEPMTSNLALDLILFPTHLTISGVKHHVVQGSKVTLECLSEGASPPAKITWMNDSTPIPADQILSSSVPHGDGTYDTTSRLSFWTTRWDNDRAFSCESRQLAVPLEQDGNILNRSHVLDVQYPPVVTVQPDDITVNETFDILLFCEYEANPRKLYEVRWFQNNVMLDIKSNPGHYEGGVVSRENLLIKNSSEKDIGNYSCQVENSVGNSTVEDYVNVDVHFVPEVELAMEPDNIVNENSKQNITLLCNVIRGNPSNLIEVEWYLDQEFLITSPNCNNSEEFSDDMCTNIEAKRLLLVEAARSFHGNYSCKGRTLAGWGQRSNDSELIVNYEPGPASLIYLPQKVIKGGSVNLTCSVDDDDGRPPATRFQWHRGAELISDIVTFDFFIAPVTLKTETNFSCRAVNSAGAGDPATVYIEVLAPPTFIINLTSYSGKIYNSSEISLICRIECSPICNIGWMKNDKVIEVTDSDEDLYDIENTQLPPDLRENYFESMQSELIFNMTNWPDEILDRFSDNDNYTCFSIENGIGPSIKSSTILGVEFPPESMTVSDKVISVIEDQIPEEVICSAKGKPEPTYRWKRYNTTNNENENGNPQIHEEILSDGFTLLLKEGVKKTDGGEIICEASNIHGSLEITTYLNVMYKPECTVTQSEMNDEKVLICTADANPNEVEFEWSIIDSNDTIKDEVITQRGVRSIVKLEQIALDENPRIFSCIVNNTVGVSEECVFTVEGFLPWWKWWSRTALLVAAGIGILILLVILLCIIIFCICRRRRAASKSPMNGVADGAQKGAENPGLYENLPFHGLQQAPNKPYRPEINDQLIYADADLKDYGPINYKQASIYARMKKIKEQQKMEFERKDD